MFNERVSRIVLIILVVVVVFGLIASAVIAPAAI
jgi:hypothetical protein